MATPSQAALAACLETADREAAVAFVAALYEARGGTVERRPDGDADFVLVDGADERRVAVHTDPAASVPTVETVVSVASTPPSTDATVRTVTDLHRQLCYAIDRQRAVALFETHLGRDFASLLDTGLAGSDADQGADGADEALESGSRLPSDDRNGESDGETAAPSAREQATMETGDESETDEGVIRMRSGDTSAAAPRTDSGTAAVLREDSGSAVAPSGTGSSGVERGTVALGLIAIVILMAALSTGPGVPLGSTLLEAVGTGGTDTTGDVAAPNWSVRSRSSIAVNATALPPGVSPSGEMDEGELAATTTAALTNTSYHLTLTYREFTDGAESGVYTEEIRVEDGQTYRADVRQVGDLAQLPPAIAETDRYSNGTVSLRHVDGETTITTGVLSPGDPFQDELAQYLRWYLSVDTARITDRTGTGDATTYRITTVGDSFAGVANATGSALITRDGLVWSVRRSYDDPYHRDVRAVVTIRITGVGSTTAPKPDWVE